MRPNSRNLEDAASLKALAHPLRLDLLEALRDGPRTATEVAAVLGQSPSNCSWHLRKLAEHGFVEEVEGVPGRSRPWRVVGEGLSWGSGEPEPETAAAGDALTDALLDRELRRLRAARAERRRQPAEWREATTLVQSALWLTAEEASDLSERLEELLLSHAERLHRPELRPEGARLVHAVGWTTLQPEHTDRSADGGRQR